MKFEIRCASWYGVKEESDPPPCKNAVFSQEIIPASKEYGTDAYVETKWFVEVNTLEELLAIAKETEHDLIIDSELIIIYDAYVE